MAIVFGSSQAREVLKADRAKRTSCWIWRWADGTYHDRRENEGVPGELGTIPETYIPGPPLEIEDESLT